MLPALSWLEETYIKGGVPEQKYALVSVFGRAAGGTAPVSTSPRRTSFARPRQRWSEKAAAYRAAAAGSAAGSVATPQLLVVANVHLDAAGGNAHRTTQLAAVGAAVAAELKHPVGGGGGGGGRSSSAGHRLPWTNFRWRSAADAWPSAVAVVCGDTNCFRVQRAAADDDLASMVAALAAAAPGPAAAASPSAAASAVLAAAEAASAAASGAHSTCLGPFVDAHRHRATGASEDTHWFARSNEDGLGHRIAAALGKRKPFMLLLRAQAAIRLLVSPLFARS